MRGCNLEGCGHHGRKWFDDLTVGMRFKSAAMTVSKEDIIRFAAEYDPQPFHLDEEAAKSSVFGGLAASGWQTAAIAMRLATECRPFGPHPLLGAGVDDLRWLKRGAAPAATASSRDVLRRDRSRKAIARVKWTAYNQHGEVVITSHRAQVQSDGPGARFDCLASGGIRQRPGCALRPQLQFVTWLEQRLRHQPRTPSWLSTSAQYPLQARMCLGPPSVSSGPPSLRCAGIHFAST